MADFEIDDDEERAINSVMSRIKSREATRASEVGSDREEIGALLERTGFNKKAFAFVRSLDKLEPDKRQDVRRSLDALFDVMDRRWGEDTTEDMFDAAGEDTLSDPEDDDPDEDEDEDEELAADADEFERHLAAVGLPSSRATVQ